MAVFTLTGEWVIETCCNKSCGVQFALPRGVYDECQRHGEGRPFYCPNGHRQWYREDAATRLRRQLEAEQRAHAQAKEEAERQREMRRKEERRVTAYRGQLTRVKNRVKNGVCPVPGCRRSFGHGKMQQHLATKHPSWKGAPDE